MIRFDQLFEKLPNGQYRERDKPVPMLSIDHRYDFFRDKKTGKIVVLYPAQRLEPWNFKDLESIEPPEFLLGGHWMYGADAGSREWQWGTHHIPGHLLSWPLAKKISDMPEVDGHQKTAPQP